MTALQRFARAVAQAAQCANLAQTVATWSSADMARLVALVRLGRPAEVVTNGPPPVIARGDNWGGRMGTPEERVRAAALHMWREVAALCLDPMPPPHGGARVTKS